MLFRYLQRNPGADAVQAAKLAKELGVMPATAAILIGRGITTAAAGRAFFNSGMESLRDPFGLAGMEQAAERIEQAICEGEKITVYGDYDVDGVCATSILVGFLNGMGAECDYYIPNRHTEGYGLNKAAIESLKGTQLLITVDCGITNAAEIARAQELGMDVIVTDHHECPDALPDCTAVINPKRPGQGYGFSGLCGAGVALKLVYALGGEEEAAAALDLAALATVADIVPLVDENLAIVRMGIELINRGYRPGIKALKEVAGLEGKPVKAGNIGFALAPRINAGGRMDLSRKSAEMMMTEDLERARIIARELNDDNAERLKVEEGILTEAIAMVEMGYSFSHRRAIVLYQPHWNTGVTGIVASRLVERYSRPTILFGSGEGACYGSGRSIPGVHLYHAMKACSEYFIRFGGHEQAAGCALTEENLEPFAAALDKYLAQTYSEDIFLPSRYYDAQIELGQLSIGLAKDMEKLEPSGFGNPRPVFLLKGVELSGLVKTADNKHLRLRFGSRDGVEGIAFRQGGLFNMLEGCSACDALIVPDVNEWMGKELVQAIVEHIKPPQGLVYARSQLGRAGFQMGKALAQALACDGGENCTIRHLGREEGMAELARAVKGSCWGTLALCFTSSSAAASLHALSEAGCLERMYTGTALAHQAVRRENALVMAPDLQQLPFDKYDTVFLFDGILARDCARWIAKRLKNGAGCIIINVDGAGAAPGNFSRTELLKVYKAMRETLAAKARPRACDDWSWLSDSVGIEPWRAEVSARIFIELGLLEELDKHPWLQPQELATKAELNNSALYRRLNDLIVEVQK